MKYYIEDGWSNKTNLNVYTSCLCGDNIDECIELWNNQIFCGNGYSSQQIATASSSCTECGCDEFYQSINYMNDNQELELEYDIICCDEYPNSLDEECTATTTSSTTDSGNTEDTTSNTDNTLIQKPLDGDDDDDKNESSATEKVVAAVVGVICIAIIVFAGWYFYRKRMESEIDTALHTAISTKGSEDKIEMVATENRTQLLTTDGDQLNSRSPSLEQSNDTSEL